LGIVHVIPKNPRSAWPVRFRRDYITQVCQIAAHL
jgi:hypothetical protein